MAAALLNAYLLDWLFGDPRRGHPVAGFGRIASALERLLWRPSRAAGVLYVATLVGATALGTAAVGRAFRRRTYTRLAWRSIVVWATLGGRSLERIALRLAGQVHAGDLVAARSLAPALVGRDLSRLGDTELCRAALESVAENTGDAIVAPLLWGALLGAPGAAAYRALNTLDAIVGHRSERHREFGWAAARGDDLANWPAARPAHPSCRQRRRRGLRRARARPRRVRPLPRRALCPRADRRAPRSPTRRGAAAERRLRGVLAARPRASPGACRVRAPSFTEPEAALRAVGTKVVRVPRERDSWCLDPSRIPDDAELVVIGNPDNPTGTLATATALVSLTHPTRRLVVDESFIELTGAPQASVAARADLPGLIVVRSITKLYGLAGIRAGYLLAEPSLVAELAAQRQPWSVNTLACRALAICAADHATPRRVAAEVAAARAELLDALSARPGVRAWPSAANFLLLRTDEADLAGALAGEGIAVRPASSFPGLDERYIRIAVRPPADNAKLMAALDKALAR